MNNIIFNGASLTPTKITQKDNAILTDWGIIAPFDQVIASALGLKGSIFDHNGSLLPGLRGWECETLLFGATIAVRAAQKDLFNGNAPLVQVKSVQTSNFIIRRHRDDEGLKLRFKVTCSGVPEDLINFIRATKKGTFDVTIEPAQELVEQNARTEAQNLGLFDGKHATTGGDAEDESSDEVEKEEAEPKFACKHCDADLSWEEGSTTHHIKNGRRVKCQHAHADPKEPAMASVGEMKRIGVEVH